MAVACPAQALPESFIAQEFDDTVTMYENDVKAEKVEQSATTIKEEFNGEKTFFDLTPTSYLFDSYNQDYSCQTDVKDFKSWTEKHPESWSNNEVLDWIFYVAAEHNLDVARIHSEKFQTVSGYQLCRMSLEEFTERDPDYGNHYYSILQQLYHGIRFIPPANIEHSMESITESSLNCPSQEILTGLTTQVTQEMEADETSKMLDNNLETMLDIKDGVPRVNIAGAWYDFDEMDIPLTDSHTPDLGYESADTDNGEMSNSLPSSLFEDEDETVAPVKEAVTKKKGSGRRMNSTSSDSGIDSEDGKSNRGRKPGQSSKGNHLWEFIRDLLKDPNLNPSLLRWEDKETGVFRFVQSEAVAQMWGRKKNNPGMTYEKLSRAMRFCRSAGYFAGVPKNGKYPKKLCFRFGPKSFGWESV